MALSRLVHQTKKIFDLYLLVYNFLISEFVDKSERISLQDGVIIFFFETAIDGNFAKTRYPLTLAHFAVLQLSKIEVSLTFMVGTAMTSGRLMFVKCLSRTMEDETILVQNFWNVMD